MRHNNKNKILKRKKGGRLALLAAISRALILEGKIETTSAKAKAARPLVEKIITSVKAGGIANRRKAASELGAAAAKRLFNEIVPRYAGRSGGYTRILKIQSKRSDNAAAVIMELV